MKYKIPDENAPGFIRREIKRQAFLEAQGSEKTAAMVEWLSEYIDDDDPEAAIINASEKEINDLIASITGMELPDPKDLGLTGDG